MAEAADRIAPRPLWPAVRNPFGSAAEAFDAGNYPLALDLAEDGSELRAAAMVMCGAVAAGLALLERFESPRARLVRAYGYWCLNRYDDARGLLGELRGTEYGAVAETFLSFLETPPDVVLLAMPGEERRKAFARVQGIHLHWIQLDADAFGATMEERLAALPLAGAPRMLLSLDAYGPYLPRRPNAPGIPLVFWAGDHDFFFATRHADLARADVIVANSAAEQTEIARHHAARCAAIPGHESYQQNKPSKEAPRDIDIYYTGRAFVPYMRDKAQFLFQLATTDDPALQIEIVEGYLAEPDYWTSLAKAKFVPLFWRSAGGLQTRAIEALKAGAGVLSPERGIARPLLGDAAALYRCAIEADVAAILADRRPDGRTVTRDLDDLFWPSPAREERLLKFCLFQTLFAERRQRPVFDPAYVPVELRGYGIADGTRIYTRIARMNGAAEPADAPNYIHAAAAAFYAAILLADNPAAGLNIAQMALDFYRSGISAFPQSLALRFNGARAMWTFGQRSEALGEFQAIVERLPDLAFDARTDALLSHRIRILAEMFPYGDFFRAAVEPAPPHSRSPGAREFIASSALTYIAADLTERGEWAGAVGVLQRAVERCPVNVAGWRLLARARAETNARPAAIREAFYRAVNLYPPELFDLLPVGLEAELADGRRVEAADVLRKWVLARARTHDVDGKPPPASEATRAAARRHRALLDDWTLPLFDRIVAPD